MKIQRCVVTGISGYTGSRLANFLVEQGVEVLGLQRPNSAPRQLNSKVQCVNIPESDKELGALFEKFRPDLAFHLAAAFFGEEDGARVEDNLQANFAYGVRLCAALKVAKASRLINVGSHWEFDRHGRPAANSCYAALKSAFAHYLSVLPERLRPQVMNVVLFDVYGPGDWRPKLMNSLFESARGGKDLEMTAGEQLVDLVFIEDVCQGLWKAAGESFEADQTRALSSGQRLRVRELAKQVYNFAKSPAKPILGAKPYAPHQVYHPAENLKSVQAWKAKVNLEEGIRQCLKN